MTPLSRVSRSGSPSRKRSIRHLRQKNHSTCPPVEGTEPGRTPIWSSHGSSIGSI
jgi:hypothetical protein